MHLLFIFLDGVGLGRSDREINPFSRVSTPTLNSLLAGKKLVLESLLDGTVHTEFATLSALDACLGVSGVPQSATGQGVLLTGINIPAKIGYHYGPKPNPEIAEFLRNGNLFNKLSEYDLSSSLLNAYPPSYFSAIQKGRRIYSSIPLAVTSAGLELKTLSNLVDGDGIAADFTAEGWHSHLNLHQTPTLSLTQAGKKLAELARKYDFSMFEYWLSDYAGHKQDMAQACEILVNFDQVLNGLLDNWDLDDGLILITSDHGNMEDLSVRRHTTNPVPLLLIGTNNSRSRFFRSTDDLTSITPDIVSALKKNLY